MKELIERKNNEPNKLSFTYVRDSLGISQDKSRKSALIKKLLEIFAPIFTFFWPVLSKWNCLKGFHSYQ